MILENVQMDLIQTQASTQVKSMVENVCLATHHVVNVMEDWKQIVLNVKLLSSNIKVNVCQIVH